MVNIKSSQQQTFVRLTARRLGDIAPVSEKGYEFSMAVTAEVLMTPMNR